MSHEEKLSCNVSILYCKGSGLNQSYFFGSALIVETVGFSIEFGSGFAPKDLDIRIPVCHAF